MTVMNLVSEPPRERRRLAWDDLLERHRLFAGYPESEIGRLVDAQASSERACAAGEVILEQGQPGDSVFFVGKGSVKVSLIEQGQTTLELAIFRKGDFFGEMVLFEPGARAATVTALQECVLLEVSSEALRELMIQHPALELALLHTMTERLRNTNERILTRKLGELPEALRLLEARLSAEVRVFDASLKAAHAVFEQTRVRSDEVISSADRTRSRLTYVGSTIATVFTLAGMALGGLGVRQLWSLKDLQSEVEGSRAAIEKFKEDAPALEKEMEAIRLTNAHAKEILADDQLLPALRNALAEGVPSTARHSFEELERLGWTNEDRVLDLLYQVEEALVAGRDASGSVSRPPLPAADSRQNFTDLLGLMAKRATKPETRAKAYSLFLANAILVGMPDADRAEVTERFRDLLAQHKEERLLSKEDWKPIEQRLGRAGEAKLEEFQRVKSLIPRG